MNKKYLYNGNIYCEDDLSEEIDNYGGCLFDLYWELKKDKKATEITYYYVRSMDGDCEYYEDYADLIKEEYEKLGIEELKAYE
jgi:hypothetical protein